MSFPSSSPGKRTFPDVEPVASGRPYLIVEVQGRQPADLDDFVGDVAFVAVMDSQTYLIQGVGDRDSSTVRVSEKRAGGRDLRVWQVTGTGTGDFEATALASY